jgi:uncharacterized protein
MSTVETLAKMKEIVHGVLPNAQVILFGSRASNKVHDESDWDLLILENGNVDRKIKREIQDALYPFSLKISSFINIVLANNLEWEDDPRYYSIKLSISQNPVIV